MSINVIGGELTTLEVSGCCDCHTSCNPTAGGAAGGGR